MFSKLSNHLQAKFSKKDDLARQLLIVKVFDIYKQETKKQFPQEAAIIPIQLKNKILTIRVLNSVLASELRFGEREIISRINRTLGKEVVKRILYRF